MNIEFVKTLTLNDSEYVDLLVIDNKPITMIMHKTAEPNIFSVKEQFEGDKFNDVMEKYNATPT